MLTLGRFLERDFFFRQSAGLRCVTDDPNVGFSAAVPKDDSNTSQPRHSSENVKQWIFTCHDFILVMDIVLSD